MTQLAVLLTYLAIELTQLAVLLTYLAIELTQIAVEVTHLAVGLTQLAVDFSYLATLPRGSLKKTLRVCGWCVCVHWCVGQFDLSDVTG